MNTKVLMTTSALTMMAAGIALSFMPHEIALIFLGSFPGTPLHIVFQLLGATYFGFGMINWTAKANLIGGIYARPIAIGNLAHYLIGALALLKAYLSSPHMVIMIVALVYVLFAVAFTVVFFRHPVPGNAS